MKNNTCKKAFLALTIIALMQPQQTKANDYFNSPLNLLLVAGVAFWFVQRECNAKVNQALTEKALELTLQQTASSINPTDKSNLFLTLKEFCPKTNLYQLTKSFTPNDYTQLANDIAQRQSFAHLITAGIPIEAREAFYSGNNIHGAQIAICYQDSKLYDTTLCNGLTAMLEAIKSNTNTQA